MKNKIANNSRRAGGYRKEITGYRAFYPAPLPPNPRVTLHGELQKLLSRADRALGRLDGSVQTLTNPDLFVLMYRRKEAVLSSQIEGTESSLQDLLEAEAQMIGRSSSAADVDEIVNYLDAMDHGLNRLAELPVSVRLFREIHQKLLQGVRGSGLSPGELRTSQNWIGSPGCTLSDATFIPPPPHFVPEALADLERFLHTEDDLPILIKIGLAHAQFETIHPFLDGNGRVGRLLVTFLLTEGEVLQRPVLYLSHYLKKNRQAYYERLQQVRDLGDWEGWLKFFVRGIIEVSAEAAEMAGKILRLREDHRTSIIASFGRSAGSGLQVLESLFLRPVVSVQQVQETIGTTYPPANNLVRRFAELGLLSEVTGNARNRKFRYDPYIRLFTE